MNHLWNILHAHNYTFLPCVMPKIIRCKISHMWVLIQVKKIRLHQWKCKKKTTVASFAKSDLLYPHLNFRLCKILSIKFPGAIIYRELHKVLRKWKCGKSIYVSACSSMEPKAMDWKSGCASWQESDQTTHKLSSILECVFLRAWFWWSDSLNHIANSADFNKTITGGGISSVPRSRT